MNTDTILMGDATNVSSVVRRIAILANSFPFPSLRLSKPLQVLPVARLSSLGKIQQLGFQENCLLLSD